MSINYINEEKSINDFSLDITEKTKSFFKTYNELTKENLETYLECINLLDIWNTKEEKEFLWNSFYKYNINGKVIESSVLKGLNEILSRDSSINSIISLEEKKDDYSTDDLNIIRLSYNKKKSSIIKYSINSSSLSEINNNNYIKNDLNNIEKFVNDTDVKELKHIKNIMILLNDNFVVDNINKNKWLVTLDKVNDLLSKYPCLEVDKEYIINYLKNICEYPNKNENIKINEFIINKNLFELSTKLIENKIKKFEKESIYNEEISNTINNEIISSVINNNNLENIIKTIINSIIDIDIEFKGYIQIFTEIEKSLKNCNQNIIDYFQKLLTMKNDSQINKSINNINDKNFDENEIKINIENNILYINNKSKELEIFIEETGKIINKKEIMNKKLNILINKIIEDKIRMEKEKNELIIKKKEDENITNKEFNIADEKINKLLEEKNLMEKKINKLMEEIDSNKILYKNNQNILKEIDNEYNLKIKELEEKNKEINILKKENKKIKDDYDSLLNEIIAINNNKENEYKEYEQKILINAKNKLEKKIKLNESQKKLCLLNHEQLLEYSIDLYEKNNLKNKKIEQINQLLNDKNKKINQLETDLELYREKTIELSKQIKALKNENNKENKTNLNKNPFTLDELGISRNSIVINENKKFSNKKSNNNELLLSNNKETPNFSNNNLFAPPCFAVNDNEKNDKLISNNDKFTPGNDSNNFISNENPQNEKLLSNDNKKINEINNDNKLFSNTSKGDVNEGKINNEENLVDIFNNIINDRPSNPFRVKNESLNNPYKNKSEKERESNPYNYNDNKENNPYKDSNIKNNSYKYNNSINFSLNENLNINDEILKNNDYENNNINNKESISQLNNLLNKNIPLYIDKSLSVKEMNDIFKKNHENKLHIEYFDYLHLYNNEKIKEMLLKIGDHCELNKIFSDIVYLLDEYDQIEKYILFITKKCIYIIEPDTYKIQYTFVRNILLRFTIANNNCNIIVFHFNQGNDLVIMTLRRPELIYYFLKMKNNDNEKTEIKFKYADEFNVKKDGRYYTQKIKSSMNSIAFNFQTALKLGYLTKINEGYIFNQFHEKLVVLTDFGLFYFDNPTVSPKKLIPIIGSEIVPIESKFNERKYVFEIRTLNKNKIVFGTDDKQEYEDWINIFNEVKTKYEKKKNEFINI